MVDGTTLLGYMEVGKTEKPFLKEEVIVNKQCLLEVIDELVKNDDINNLRKEIKNIKNCLRYSKNDKIGILNIDNNGDTFKTNRNLFLDELTQIEESQTIERAKYYLERLNKGIAKIRTNKINDINLNRWKEYNDIITDSLWVLGQRDRSGAHLGDYWGNFIPQIPHQMMLRYTKKNDWVLDAFLGSGTTLIECKRLGRNGIGVELQEKVAKGAEKLIEKEYNKHDVNTKVFISDSTKFNFKEELKKIGVN